MANRKKTEIFIPSDEQMALWPNISGNEINGLGELKHRRPSPVMWHDPDIIPHGDVQTWFWEQGAKEPSLYAMRGARERVINQENGPLAPLKEQLDPHIASQDVVQLAHEAGAELVGIVRAQPEWVFEGYEFDYPWVIILGVAMDHDKLKTAPEVTSAMEVVDKYTKGWVVGRPVADWIRAKGWRAVPSGGPAAGPITLTPAAIAAGFGELGKHGSIINREYGSSFRLSAVFTDLPLVEDKPVDIGAEDFCLNCQVCVNACPTDAIINDKQTVRGDEKWYVDFDRCFPYFAETAGCGICIAACPWSTPGRGPLMSDKMLRKRLKKTGV